MRILLSTLVVLASSIAVGWADDDKSSQSQVVAQAGVPQSGQPVSGTPLVPLGPTTVRSVFGHAPLADADLQPPDKALAATLGFHFRSSALDGDGSQASDPMGAPSFATFHPWMRVSGTLASGRAWYRLSADLQKDEQPIDVASETRVQTTRLSLAAPRITWQVSPRNRLALEYQGQTLERDRLGLSSTLGPGPSLSTDADLDSFALTWSAPVSSNLEVRSSLQWRKATDRVFPSTRGRTNDCVASGPWLDAGFLEDAHCRNLTSQRNSGSHFLDVDATAQHLSARSRISLRDVRLWGAIHLLKAGFTIENERRSRTFESRPRIEHVAIRPVFDPDAAGIIPEDVELTSAFLALPAALPGGARGTAWSLYLEDAIRPRDNLVVTLGGLLERHERSSEGWTSFDPSTERERFLEQRTAGVDPEVIFAGGTFTAYEGIDRLYADLAAAIGVPSLIPAVGILPPPRAPWPRSRARKDIELTSTDLSPYVSLSWDPSSDGKTKLALSARRRHDGVPLEALVLAQNPVTSSLRFLGVAEGTEVFPYRLSGEFGAPEVSTRTVSRDLQPTTHLEYLLTFERELSTSATLRLSLVERRYRDQLRSQDVNHLPGDFGRCLVNGADWGTSPFNRPGPVAESPGSDFELIDAYTGETYIDTDPGIGDGRLDDCRGNSRIGQFFFYGAAAFETPDGRPDLYKQNPGWGSVVVIDNSGRSNYEAVVVELIRRQHEDWQFHGSYTWSRHRGNYDRLEAFDEMDRSLSDDTLSYQADDRRHELQLEATAHLSRGYRLGGSASWRSGLPYSILRQGLSFDTIPDYGGLEAIVSSRNRLQYSGDRNRGRNAGQWLFNLMATRAFSPRSGNVVEISVAVDNVLDDDTYQVYNADYGMGLQINGIDGARREFGRRWQLGLTSNW